MRKLQQTTLLALLFLLLTGFTSDPNGKANALCVNAFKLMQSVKKETGSYIKALDLYRSAREKIDRITTDYAAANIAVALISEQTKIAGLALGGFEQLEGHLRPLAEAEQDPLACALLVAGNIEHNVYKAKALPDIAGRYIESGQKKKAARLLAQTDGVNATRKTSDSDFNISTILLVSELAGHSARIGQPEKANQLFAQAIEMSITNTDGKVKAVLKSQSAENV